MNKLERKTSKLQRFCATYPWARCLNGECPLEKYCKTDSDDTMRDWAPEKIYNAYSEAVQRGIIKE